MSVLIVIPAKAGIQLFPLSRWRERVGVRVALDVFGASMKSKSFRG